MDFFAKIREKKWFNGAVIACIGVAFFMLLLNMGTVLDALRKFLGFFKPVILGVIIAYVISPLTKVFHYRLFRGIKRGRLRWYLSVFLSFGLMLLAFSLLIGTLLPQLVGSIVMLSKNFDSYAQSLIRLVESSPLKNMIGRESMEVLTQNAMSAISTFVSETADNALSIAANAGKNILSIVLGLILAVYLLADVKNVLIGTRRFLSSFLPQETYLTFMDFILRCDTILVTYIVQSLLDSLIIGAANAILMAIFKMPYIGLISVVVGVTNLIPSFGPAIGAVVGAFILLLVNPKHIVPFLIFCLVLQTIDAYILKPKLFSSALGVSGLSILIATIVLGNMFGILGVLLAIPAAAILSFLYHDYYLPSRRRLRKKAAAKKTIGGGG